MKAVNEDRLQQLMTWKANSQFFVEKVAPWMRDNIGRVDFDEVNSECGTFACAAGWYSVMRHNMFWCDYHAKLTKENESKKFEYYEFGPDMPWVFGFAESVNATQDLNDRVKKVALYVESLQTQIDALCVGAECLETA